MCVSDASVATAIAASGAGCASGTAFLSTCLLLLNAASRWGDHSVRVYLQQYKPDLASVDGELTAKMRFSTL